MTKKPDDNQVTGLFSPPGDNYGNFLLAAFRAVAFAVLVDDGLVFCVTENDCVILRCVGLCACHVDLLYRLIKRSLF